MMNVAKRLNEEVPYLHEVASLKSTPHENRGECYGVALSVQKTEVSSRNSSLIRGSTDMNPVMNENAANGTVAESGSTSPLR
jgi:hypothetical protein